VVAQEAIFVSLEFADFVLEDWLTKVNFQEYTNQVSKMDTIADFLTIIRNGYSAKKETVSANYSKVKHALADTLYKNGYLEAVEVENKKEVAKKKLVLSLKYINDIPAITQIKRVSKPSVRIYASSRKIPASLSGTGITIVSTSKGMMTDKKARKEKLGGEIICKVY